MTRLGTLGVGREFSSLNQAESRGDSLVENGNSRTFLRWKPNSEEPIIITMVKRRVRDPEVLASQVGDDDSGSDDVCKICHFRIDLSDCS